MYSAGGDEQRVYCGREGRQEGRERARARREGCEAGEGSRRGCEGGRAGRGEGGGEAEGGYSTGEGRGALRWVGGHLEALLERVELGEQSIQGRVERLRTR